MGDIRNAKAAHTAAPLQLNVRPPCQQASHQSLVMIIVHFIAVPLT